MVGDQGLKGSKSGRVSEGEGSLGAVGGRGERGLGLVGG